MPAARSRFRPVPTHEAPAAVSPAASERARLDPTGHPQPLTPPRPAPQTGYPPALSAARWRLPSLVYPPLPTLHTMPMSDCNR
jgi:hypothetical protein